MKRMWILITIILIIIFCIFCYFFVGNVKKAEHITWGANFSPKQAQDLGLDPKETYIAILDDLKVDNLKLAMHWDLIEKKDDDFNLEDFDWYMQEAQKRNVDVLIAIGMKTPRWPEVHMPVWAENLTKQEQQAEILEMEKFVIERYKDYSNLYGWQIENEPLFPYGETPWRDKDFLKKEIAIARTIDSNHDIITTDTGEMSLWFSIAKIADSVGITMYTKIWFKELNAYVDYPLNPTFYGRKAELVMKLFNKKVICVELQAEPWCYDLTQNCSAEEQAKSMDLERFNYNIEFAKKTGLDTFFLWGAEWWYWQKTINNDPDIWNQAKNLWN